MLNRGLQAFNVAQGEALRTPPQENHPTSCPNRSLIAFRNRGALGGGKAASRHRAALSNRIQDLVEADRRERRQFAALLQRLDQAFRAIAQGKGPLRHQRAESSEVY